MMDKTELIYELIKPPVGLYFLSRPRRFGKSLLLSILECYFLGKRELFQGLWLYDKQGLSISLFPSLHKVKKYLIKYSEKNIIDDDFFNNYTEMVYQMLKCYRIPKRMVKHPSLTEDDFKRIKCPVMVIIGENEIIYNADAAIEWAQQKIPNVYTLKIANYGHTIQYDQPEFAAKKNN